MGATERIEKACGQLARSPRLLALAALAERRGQGIWLVGGALRDSAMELTAYDLDLAADGDAVALAREFAATQRAAFVLLDQRHKSARVAWASGHLDLSGLRAPTIAQDLAARDFTINAMAFTLAGGPRGLLDPLGGIKDLEERILRPCGPTVLRDDPLRVLRAFRFYSTLRMNLPEQTAQALDAAGPGLFRVAAERVREEWLKLMAGERAGQAVAAMDRAHVLTRLAPELRAGKGMAQNRFHHLDVFRHGLAALSALDGLAEEPGHGGLGEAAARYLADPARRAILKTATLFHDLGKPTAVAPKEGQPGEFSFYNHENLGAALARRRCRALGLSKAAANTAAALVAAHMRPHQLWRTVKNGGLSRRAARRMLEAAGEHLAGLFLMALADARAGKGEGRPEGVEEGLVELFGLIVARREAELAQAMAAPPLVDGRRVMSELGMPPGPELGGVLKRLREAQLDGEIASTEEALEMARRLLAKTGP